MQTLHGIVERSGRALRLRRLITRVIGRLSARTIVHTQADLALLPGAVRARTVVIAHGEYGGLARTAADAEREASRAALGIAADAPVTLMFGQLRADKGLGELVQALRRLPALHLLIGGQDLGALAAVSEQFEQPELAGRVTVREGFLDMSVAAELFAAADTVALPYPSASQSGVLLLAYGFHRPVVIYPVGGLVEAVIDGQTGWICSRPDVDALVDALAQSIEAGAAECLRRGQEGAKLAEERFSWPAIARRTERALRAGAGGCLSERELERGRTRRRLAARGCCSARSYRRALSAKRPCVPPPSVPRFEPDRRRRRRGASCSASRASSAGSTTSPPWPSRSRPPAVPSWEPTQPPRRASWCASMSIPTISPGTSPSATAASASAASTRRCAPPACRI